MKALVYTGPEQIAVQEMLDPVPEEGEVLVDVAAADGLDVRRMTLQEVSFTGAYTCLQTTFARRSTP